MHAAPHIYTLTGNLLAERTLEFEIWESGHTQRAFRESFHTRGKGINVSNMLNRLGVSNTALFFSGGIPGAECEAWLRQRAVNFRAFPTLKSSRTGTVVWSNAQPETTFLGPDVAPDAAALSACAAFLDALPDGQVLALCGSFPGWNDPSCGILGSALERWLGRGKLAVDAYGPPLTWLGRHPLDLVKINRAEFDTFLPANQPNQPLRDRLLFARSQSPVRNWIVTQGAGSIWLVAQEGHPVELKPPTVREISATGSGDVFFAGLLHARFILGQSLPDAARYAIPFAAANAAHPGVADFDLPDGKEITVLQPNPTEGN